MSRSSRGFAMHSDAKYDGCDDEEAKRNDLDEQSD
jgi:hypothetical protein